MTGAREAGLARGAGDHHDDPGGAGGGEELIWKERDGKTMKKGITRLQFKAALLQLLNDALDSERMESHETKEVIREAITEAGRYDISRGNTSRGNRLVSLVATN